MTTNGLDPETEQQVLDLYQAGTKLADITSETGVGRSTIYWLLSKHDIAPTRMAKRPPRPSPMPDTEGVATSDLLRSWYGERLVSIETRQQALTSLVDELVLGLEVVSEERSAQTRQILENQADIRRGQAELREAILQLSRLYADLSERMTALVGAVQPGVVVRDDTPATANK